MPVKFLRYALMMGCLLLHNGCAKQLTDKTVANQNVQRESVDIPAELLKEPVMFVFNDRTVSLAKVFEQIVILFTDAGFNRQPSYAIVPVGSLKPQQVTYTFQKQAVQDGIRKHSLTIIGKQLENSQFNQHEYLKQLLTAKYLVPKGLNQNLTFVEEKRDYIKYVVLLGGNLQHRQSTGKIIIGNFYRVGQQTFLIQHELQTTAFNIKIPEQYPTKLETLVELSQELNQSFVCDPQSPSEQCLKWQSYLQQQLVDTANIAITPFLQAKPQRSRNK